MTQPPRQQINSELGWKRLTHTLSKTMPQRLAYSRDVRHGIRNLMKRGAK